MANIGTPISFGRSRPLKDLLLDHFSPRTEIGHKLLALRRAYLVGGGKLLSWEEIDQEMREVGAAWHMNRRRTYIDANVLIAASRGDGEVAAKAAAVLDDPGRMLVVSNAVWLEIMPKALYHRQQQEAEFYKAVFAGKDFIKHLTTMHRSPILRHLFYL